MRDDDLWSKKKVRIELIVANYYCCDWWPCDTCLYDGEERMKRLCSSPAIENTRGTIQYCLIFVIFLNKCKLTCDRLFSLYDSTFSFYLFLIHEILIFPRICISHCGLSQLVCNCFISWCLTRADFIERIWYLHLRMRSIIWFGIHLKKNTLFNHVSWLEQHLNMDKKRYFILISSLLL